MEEKILQDLAPLSAMIFLRVDDALNVLFRKPNLGRRRRYRLIRPWESLISGENPSGDARYTMIMIDSEQVFTQGLPATNHNTHDPPSRIFLIGPEDTKEGQWKRVPIHWALFPILEDVMKVRSIGSDKVFLKDGCELTRGNGRRPWEDAVRDVGLIPAPHFHDLRHTWKTNARRSGMDPEIRESIMGHWYKEKSVSERYGRISDEELLRAIDLMTFNHGETEIVVSKRQKQNPGKGGHPQSGNLRTRRVQNDI